MIKTGGWELRCREDTRVEMYIGDGRVCDPRHSRVVQSMVSPWEPWDVRCMVGWKSQDVQWVKGVLLMEDLGVQATGWRFGALWVGAGVYSGGRRGVWHESGIAGHSRAVDSMVWWLMSGG
jgi:hypothetical protein